MKQNEAIEMKNSKIKCDDFVMSECYVSNEVVLFGLRYCLLEFVPELLVA